MTKKKPYHIIIVDDEVVAMRYYQQALELDGYNVQHYTSVDDIKAILFDKPNPSADLFIIDIMIPPGELYSGQNTDEGLYTGLFLAQDIRRKYADKPIIILSNTIFPSVRGAAKRLSSRLNNCIVIHKMDTTPTELADVANQYFKEFELHPQKSKSIFKRLYKGLLLQPNFSGIGIDLKKLGEDE